MVQMTREMEIPLVPVRQPRVACQKGGAGGFLFAFAFFSALGSIYVRLLPALCLSFTLAKFPEKV